MTTADLLRDLDQRNRDEYARQRIRGLVDEYLAPAPSDGAGVVGIPVPAAVPPPHRWRPAVGRAPAATTPATAAEGCEAGTTVDSRDERPSATGRETRGHPFVSRPYSQGRPTGDGRSAPGRGGRMGRPSRPLP